MTPTGRRSTLGAVARVALLPAGALAVHQLRFWLAFGHGAGAELRLTGHSYLHSLLPWIVLGLALAAGLFLHALGRAFAGHRSARRYATSLLVLWLAGTVCLLAIYIAQESLEGLVLTGHPGGLAGVFGFGGWWAIPSAAAVGLVLAASLHGARWALDQVARRAAAPAWHRPAGPPERHRPAPIALPRLAPLAEGWSGRGPPR